MSTPRRQHYVPQTYLNNFDNYSSKQPHVFTLSKSNSKIYNAAVEDVAVEKHFYTLHKNKPSKTDEEKFAWENYYARNIEPQLSILVQQLLKTCNNALIQDNAVVLNKQQKELLSSQLLAQLLRGKSARTYTNELYREQLPIVANSIKGVIPPSDTKKLKLLSDFETNDDYFLETSMQAILYGIADKKSYNVMRDRVFILFRIMRDPLFVTSDHPVAFVDVATHNATPFKNGLIYPSTVVFFPLAPNLLLGIFHPLFRNGYFTKRDCRLHTPEYKQQIELTQYHNRIQMIQCNNYVYSQSANWLKGLIDIRNNKPLIFPFNL